MSYESDLAKEQEAEKRLRQLADELVNDCSLLWGRGDGNGGYVMETIRQAFQMRLGFPVGGPIVRTRKAIPATVKKTVFERDMYRCVKCSSFKNLCLDHVHPWSLGGSDEPENLQTLCHSCNSKKGDAVE